MPTTFGTVAFASARRAALVSLLTSYKADVGIKLQVYPGRPATIYPPCAFPDVLRERMNLSGPVMRQRNASDDVMVIHGTFDSADTVAQRDAFVDGFTAWLLENPHAAGASTLLGDTVDIEDIPGFVPDWIIPPAGKPPTVYFGTRITVAGYVAG